MINPAYKVLALSFIPNYSVTSLREYVDFLLICKNPYLKDANYIITEILYFNT